MKSPHTDPVNSNSYVNIQLLSRKAANICLCTWIVPKSLQPNLWLSYQRKSQSLLFLFILSAQ